MSADPRDVNANTSLWAKGRFPRIKKALGSVGSTDRRARVLGFGGGVSIEQEVSLLSPIPPQLYHHLGLGRPPAGACTLTGQLLPVDANAVEDGRYHTRKRDGRGSGSLMRPLFTVDTAPTPAPYPPLAILYRPISLEKDA